MFNQDFRNVKYFAERWKYSKIFFLFTLYVSSLALLINRLELFECALKTLVGLHLGCSDETDSSFVAEPDTNCNKIMMNCY